MFHMPHFGKRKFGGSIKSTSDFMASPKNQRVRPCRDIVYTEDSVPVRKLYFSVASAEVSDMQTTYKKNFFFFDFYSASENTYHTQLTKHNLHIA